MKYFSAKPGALSAPLELARFGRLPFSITTVSGLHIYQRDLEAWRVAARSHPATVAHCRDCAEFYMVPLVLLLFFAALVRAAVFMRGW